VKRYEGRREGYAADVSVNDRPLNPRLDLWNHSPTGFEWGYGGSGPAQLALALLADHFGDDQRPLSFIITSNGRWWRSCQSGAGRSPAGKFRKPSRL